MVYKYSLDLKVARRKSGLSQVDCAHLAGVIPSRISKLEAGKSLPTLTELAILCLAFGTRVDAVSDQVVGSLAQTLQERTASMPVCPDDWPDRYNRTSTLDALAARLEALSRMEA